jgi:hypothetical protein
MDIYPVTYLQEVPGKETILQIHVHTTVAGLITEGTAPPGIM